MYMAINFIKNIVNNKVDDHTHYGFTRYGSGEYPKDEFKVKKSAKDIKISAGFEYTNTLLKFVTSLCNGKIDINGTIITQEDLEVTLNKCKLNFTTKVKRGMRGLVKTEYSIEGSINKDDLLTLINQLFKFYLFLDIKQGKREYKVKKKAVPKIGKDTPKFVNAIIDISDEKAVKDEFLFDIENKDFKDISIFHTYNIEEIVVDEKLIDSNPEKARLEAKRKGKLVRKIVVDGKEIIKEYSMNV